MGALGVCAPQRAEKNFWAKFTRESCKCTPRQSIVQFFRKLGDLHGGSS